MILAINVFETWAWDAGQDAAPDELFVILFTMGIVIYAINSIYQGRNRS